MKTRSLISLFLLFFSTCIFSQVYHRLISEKELLEQKRKSIIRIKIYSSNESNFTVGTGFFISKKNGIILTNFHVMQKYLDDPTSKIEIIDYKNEQITNISIGKCESKDGRKVDLCLLKVDDYNALEYFQPESKKIGKGHQVWSIGNPIKSHQNFIIKSGKIVELYKNGHEILGMTLNFNINTEQFQTSIQTEHGDSGSPLFSSNGTLLGIQTELNRAKDQHLAISVNEIIKFITTDPSAFIKIPSHRVYKHFVMPTTPDFIVK